MTPALTTSTIKSVPASWGAQQQVHGGLCHQGTEEVMEQPQPGAPLALTPLRGLSPLPYTAVLGRGKSWDF